MKEYYIVSKKYSGQHHLFFTLWAPNDNGYVYAVEEAGRYSEERIEKNKLYYTSESAIPIEKSIVKSHMVKYLVDDYICHVLPISVEVLNQLGIKGEELRGSGPIPQSRRIENIKDLTIQGGRK